MVIIYEIAAKKIIPSVKGILVHKLYEKGYSQRKIAGILDLTQPQIHKYLNKPINYYYEKLSIEGLDTDRIEHYIKVLISAIEKGDQLKYTLMINSIIHELLMNIVCREYRIFKQFCEKGRLTDPNIEYYREWLDKITRKPKLNKLIPEVGTNIVYSPSKPLNQSDIIGLTGRIVKVGSSLRIVGEPLYGGSRHLSRILLLANRYYDKRRVAMNIAYINELEGLKNKYKIIYCGPHSSLNDFWSSVEKILAKKPDIIVDYGGYGLEPNIYIICNIFEELDEILDLLLSKY